MSIFSELLPKLSEISNTYTKNFNDDLKAVFECFDKFEEEYQNGRSRGREKAQKDKNPMTTLQSINEDEDEPNKNIETNSTKRRSSNKSANNDTVSRSSLESNNEKSSRGSKKRSKNEMDGTSSPEQDKRQKRNASVKAQSIITKQVNVNLTQKMRREDSSDKNQRNRKKKDDDKENAEPMPVIQIKQEKVSLPPEPMDLESLPLDIEVKQEVDKDEIAMPPPAAPVPRPRKAAAKEVKERSHDETSEEEGSGRRRTTRTRKQTDTLPVAAARSTRGSRAKPDAEESQPPEARPKRTRAKKKVSEPPVETDKEIPSSQESSAPASPAEKPRPKRTRRGQKAAEKEPPKPEEPMVPVISPKEERISQPQDTEKSSPILQPKTKSKAKGKKNQKDDGLSKEDTVHTIDETDTTNNMVLEQTRVIPNLNSTVTIGGEMDKTVVIPNGVYNHAPVTPKSMNTMNSTVVLETCNRETIVLDKPHHTIMDATVVIDKDPKATMLTDDNSLLTDDEDPRDKTPPKQQMPITQPTSAVKEKVQQFEEMASRVTRTKTRAMAKKEEQPETQTPPDKISKPVLSVETLNKMNNMIFNGKAPQISSSASKPRSNIVTSVKSLIPASTSKLAALSKQKEAAEESMKREKEDARKKKEAMLEAKREMQKRKREEKMAAAAAAREAAERERRLAMEAAARDRMEKQAHADLGKMERVKEAERKKAELARKVAETEERRKAEELARQLRLADEHRRADAARRKQLEEAEAMKKEAAIMAKEIEKRQKEYIEKQKMKNRSTNDKHHTPLKTPGTPHGARMEPVYMADGFQFLNSDEDDDPPERPAPAWSTSKARKQALMIQCQVSAAHIDRLFSVRVHSPDLRDIFPEIDRSRLKRTSSAVWRTPPNHRLPTLQE